MGVYMEIYRDATNGCNFGYGFMRRMKPPWNTDGLKPRHITFIDLPQTYLESPIVDSDSNNVTFTKIAHSFIILSPFVNPHVQSMYLS
jgi:hypothetical protein